MEPQPYIQRHKIPIFECHFWTVIADDPAAVLKTFPIFTNETPRSNTFFVQNVTQGHFGVFLPGDHDANDLAHEVFHATHRILDWANCNFDAEHHEQGAMLCGYLTELAYYAAEKYKEMRAISERRRVARKAGRTARTVGANNRPVSARRTRSGAKEKTTNRGGSGRGV